MYNEDIMIFYDKMNDKIKYIKYWKYYEDFINKHMNDELGENEVVHRHHIIPKSYLKTLDEINNPDNIIKLSPINHIIAHKLLYLSLRSSKMLKAIIFLTKYNHYKFDDNIIKHTAKFINKYKNFKVKSNDYIWINNGLNNLVIDPSEFDHYKSLGYNRGMLSKSNNREGLIIISKDGVSKYIDPNNLYEYISKGWKRGFKRKSIIMNNGIDCKRVNESDIQYYIDNGWTPGYRKRTKESKMRGKVSIVKGSDCKLINRNQLEYYKSLGYTLGNNKIGKIMINNGRTTSMYVYPDELTYYLNSGWIKGNITKVIAVNLDGIVKYIKPEELSKYINDGWKRGYGKPPKTRGLSLMSKIIDGKLIRKYIESDQVNTYLTQGWNLGNGNKL